MYQQLLADADRGLTIFYVTCAVLIALPFVGAVVAVLLDKGQKKKKGLRAP